MERTKRNAKKVLLFALCCVFIFCTISFIGANVNAIESENAETQETIPTGTYTYEEMEEGIVYINFLDQTKAHVKIVLLSGETTEKDVEYILHEEGYYEIGTGTEYAIQFIIDEENNKLLPYTAPEEDNKLEDTAKEIGVEIEKLVVIIAGILSALGVSGAFIGSFAKWFLNKLRKNNEDLKDSKAVLKEAKEMFEESIKNNEEATQVMKDAKELMSSALALMEKYYNETKNKQDAVDEIVSEVLTEGTENEIN